MVKILSLFILLMPPETFVFLTSTNVSIKEWDFFPLHLLSEYKNKIT